MGLMVWEPYWEWNGICEILYTKFKPSFLLLWCFRTILGKRILFCAWLFYASLRFVSSDNGLGKLVVAVGWIMSSDQCCRARDRGPGLLKEVVLRRTTPSFWGPEQWGNQWGRRLQILGGRFPLERFKVDINSLSRSLSASQCTSTNMTAPQKPTAPIKM